MDVKTRWNSTYKMLEVALKFRRVFERMYEEWFPFTKYFQEKDEKGNKRMGPPLADDWDNAKSFVHFLKNFYDATLELSASKTPTSHLISLSMFALQIEIGKRCSDGSDPNLANIARAMKVKFDKYWGNWNKMNPLIFIASVLDPRNKLKMLTVSVKKLRGKKLRDDDQELQELCDRFKNDLVCLWGEYKGVHDTLSTQDQKPYIEHVDNKDNIGQGGLHLFDEIYNGMEEEVCQDQLKQISNEVDKYLADEMEQRSNPSFDLLDWWKVSGTRYQILSLIAKDIFAIPSSTVASESTFSLGKRIVDPFRTSLSPKMVEALVCTND
ncbi:zinc finger BED domain-containing protein RICESLEEPER 1-like [Salvia hispanica]|uniref:zinc finger BED domain-containing protein RICESLEEPER 1-like n=1 Tax=Salvia hispanica TaxID=49212 RepID=UPI0020096981|nr:zinc finger BED domain-containing protein RICESLEEPER 1-like [Salvia hispanica]